MPRGDERSGASDGRPGGPLAGAVGWARSPGGRKLVRYSMVSVVAVAISQAVLAVCYGVLDWSARVANITAVCVSAVPAYYLNRAWAWGKRGRSHLLKEIVPFWAMALLGLVLSTWATDAAESYAVARWSSRLVQTVIVMAASLAAFGVLWVAKFAILNRYLFVDGPRRPEAEPGGGQLSATLEP